MTPIKINNAKFFAYHGVIEYEKEVGNTFQVDIAMKCDIALEDSDDLNKTVDYLSVYKLVDRIFTSKKFNLIETVNENICKSILDNFPLVKSVKVNIRKPNAPLGLIDSVEIINKLDRK